MLLKACWLEFDSAVKMAEGRELRKSPRGGGRDLARIIDHVLMADVAYLKRIGWKIENAEEDEVAKALDQVRLEIQDGFAAAARGGLPAEGP